MIFYFRGCLLLRFDIELRVLYHFSPVTADLIYLSFVSITVLENKNQLHPFVLPLSITASN